MTDQASELSQLLEVSESAGASVSELVALLRAVETPDVLWEVADMTIAYANIMGAIYQRAQEIGASETRGIGFLALAHVLAGEFDLANSLVGDLAERTTDDVVLTAWALLPPDASARLERLKQACARAPNSVRLLRQFATEMLRAGTIEEARRAHEALLAREPDPAERARIREVMRRQGWL